jgi:hypothetical protein
MDKAVFISAVVMGMCLGVIVMLLIQAGIIIHHAHQ